MIHLIVTIPFGDYAAGDRITDPALVEKYKDSGFTVRVSADEPPKKPDPAK